MNAIPPSSYSQRALDSTATCRSCGTTLRETFVDLGMSPLCQTHIEPHRLNVMEPFYPLHVWVCHECFLVQLEEFVSPTEIFSDYAYFSSYSDSWVEHARQYVDMACDRFQLNGNSLVMEIASNDGYLLQHFLARKVPCRGIEPAANVAASAIGRGIPTTVRFFGADTAQDLALEFGLADLLLGNNVLAHVPNINDFVSGLKKLLAPTGVITMEFPHLERLMAENQFDTIYHEHFSYLSLGAVVQVFARHSLKIFDVERLPTHGGSLRIYACHVDNAMRRPLPSVDAVMGSEERFGLRQLSTYGKFSEKVRHTKNALLTFLIEAKNAGKTVAGYGAPGKGNTLLNYCGIRTDFLDFTVDRNPYKQGRYTPGTRIPIFSPERIREVRPDFILILPWNLRREIVQSASYVRDWGGRFVVPIPQLEIL